MRKLVMVVLLVVVAFPLSAQEKAPALETVVIAETSLNMFEIPSDYILRAARKMPEEHYSFKPSDDVRSFGEIVAHVADGYRLICSIAVGDPRPEFRAVEESTSGKAELIAAVEDAADYCREAHERLDGARGAESADFFGRTYPRVTLLFFNTSHAWEHYGNLVTYMRIKGVVPPSSEPRR